MKNYILTILLFSSSYVLYAQETENSIIQMEKQFENLRSSESFKSSKGWKWQQRWLEHYAQRTTLGKQIPDPGIFTDYAANKVKTQLSTKSASSWIPYGPNYKPESPNPYSSHGVSRINCIAFHPTDANTFWIGASQGGVWKTSNAGQSWTPLNNGLPILRISDILVNPSNPDILYASLGDFEYNAVALNIDDRKRHTHYGVGMYKSEDGGYTWKPTGLTTQQIKLDFSLLRGALINSSNPNELVAGGLEGIWKSYDAGTNWVQIAKDTLICDLEQDPTNPSIIYVASTSPKSLGNYKAAVYKSTDFGETWTELNTGIPNVNVRRIEIAISPQDPNYIYALTCNLNSGFEGLYRSTNGGTSWTQQSSLSDGINILGWYDGTSSGDRGQGFYDLALTVSPTNKDIIYTGGVNVWGSDDGGKTWKGASYWTSQYGPSTHADQHQFKVNPIDNKIYVCNDGGIFRTDDIKLRSFGSGNWETVWEDISDGMQITSFYRLGLSKSKPGVVIAGAQDNSTFYYNGIEWSNIIGGDGMECLIFPENENWIMGSSQYGNLVLSNDAGRSYSAYGPNGVGEWTTPFIYHENEHSIYVGMDQVYVSTDFGYTWSKISSFPQMNGAGYASPSTQIAQSIKHPETIYLAKRIYHSYNEPSSIWKTDNQGSTWTNISVGLPTDQYPTYIASDDDDINLAWVVYSGFEEGKKVYQTNDGGASWQNISLNLPNIPVNCIVSDNTDNHRLFIATDLGVYTKDDTEANWSLFADGLPNVITSELEIDFNTNELYAATFGRGIWKISLESVGIRESNLPQFNFSISPNPSSGQFTIQFDKVDNTKSLGIHIIDIMGRTVFQESHKPSGSFNKTYNLNLKPGLYFYKVKLGNTYTSKRFIIQ